MNLESLTFIKRIIEIALISYEKASAIVTDLGEERLFSEVMEYRMGTSKGEEEAEQHCHLVNPPWCNSVATDV